jgi:hypothetical protein
MRLLSKRRYSGGVPGVRHRDLHARMHVCTHVGARMCSFLNTPDDMSRRYIFVAARFCRRCWWRLFSIPFSKVAILFEAELLETNQVQVCFLI